VTAAAASPRIAPTAVSRPEETDRPAEQRVLLACARLDVDAEVEARLRPLASAAIDWAAVLALAERNGVIPFLHRRLDLLRSIGMPDDVADRLRTRQREEAHRALSLAGELRRVLDLLGAAGIEALPYKGPTLAMRAYGGLAARGYVDLDLLVRPEDAARAIEVLREAGYESAYRFTPAQDACFRRIDGDYPLVHRETGTLLELHCRVSSQRFCVPLETAELMRRARPVSLGGTEVPAPCDEDLLLILAVHGCKHRWKRLEWIAAVAALLGSGTIDLPALLARAAALRARRALLLALALARRLLEAPLPEPIVEEIESDAVIGGLADEAERRMFGPAPEEETAANFRYNLRARDGAIDRVRSAYRWTILPSPEDWAWRKLPDVLFPLYRVLRPLRLLLRYGRPR
jgi:putative nucleotidyltransferase-like protein